MIKINNLTMKYGKNVIINKFNYIFNDNTITAIMGESGAGKSTLIRCIAGLNKYSGGEILYNNIKITKPNKDIFMMHQHYSNFPWKNCLDNVLFPLSLQKKITEDDKQQAILILESVGLKDHISKFPSELSGGMNQRLAFARILMAKPKVILMDEPMSALDSKTRDLMQKLLLQLHKQEKNTIILITHSEEEAKKLTNNIIKF